DDACFLLLQGLEATLKNFELVLELRKVGQQAINLLASRTRGGCELRQPLGLAETLLEADVFISLKSANPIVNLISHVRNPLESADDACLLLLKRHEATLKCFELLLKPREPRHRALDPLASIVRGIDKLRQLLEFSEAILQAGVPILLQPSNFPINRVSHISQRRESGEYLCLFFLYKRQAAEGRLEVILH